MDFDTHEHPDLPQEIVFFTPAEEAEVLLRIEAGVVADAALDGRMPLSRDVSEADLRAVVADGERARLELLRVTIGLVGWVAGDVARLSGREPDELFQDGMVGLLEAIQRFDLRRGRFSTYAVPRIKMRVWDAAVTDHGSIGLPPRRARQWRRAKAASARLAVTLARPPRVEDVAAATGETVGVVQALLAYVPPVCLAPDAPSWADAVTDGAHPGLARLETATTVRRLLRRLDDFDRALVGGLFGLDGPARSHAEVARDLGRSESTIRRRERRALDLLRAGTEEALAA